jgi:RNase P subunit RPR2
MVAANGGPAQTGGRLTTYDWNEIERRRVAGEMWPAIARDLGVNENTLRSAYSRRKQRGDAAPAPRSLNGQSVWEAIAPNPAPSGMWILALDIETAPNTAHVWGLYKQTIAPSQLIHTGRVMCFAARWLGGPAVGTKTMFASEHRDGHQRMIEIAHDLLGSADAVVHYNGTRFDMPTLNREFLAYGMNPPSPYAQIDLLQVARKRFRFVSNRLDHLLKELRIGEKVRHDGHRLWVQCMNGDPEAWERMEEYNRGDVDQLEELYRVMRPWISGHPNHALYQDTERPTCTNCGGTTLQSRGTTRTKTQQYRRFQCQDCGTWVRERFTALPKNKRNHILTQAV